MGTVKLQGIVIGERIQGESNKQIVVLAKGVGRVLLSARGARKAKSKLLAAAQLFCYADFVAYEGRGFYSVTQAELLNSFYALRTDMKKLAEAVYLAELTDRTCPEGTEQDEILALLYYALTVMEKGILPPQMVSRIFELKLLQISGFFAPPVCAVCGSEDGRLFFDWQEGTFLCERHHTPGSILLHGAVRRAAAFVLGHEVRQVFGFNLAPDALQQLENLLGGYMEIHMGLKLKSRHFFR